jgi:hypothetical protein
MFLCPKLVVDKLGVRGIGPTCVRFDRLPCHVLANIRTAGRYTSASNTVTVERINTLLPSVSIPRDVCRANHEGSIHAPLQKC